MHTTPIDALPSDTSLPLALEWTGADEVVLTHNKRTIGTYRKP